jgi:hypothetical protein
MVCILRRFGMQGTLTSPRMVRVMLMGQEILPIPAGIRRLRVRSGRAWVTVDGQDLTLIRGQEVGLGSRAGKAVVSTLGRMPVVVELLQDSSRGKLRLISGGAG